MLVRMVTRCVSEGLSCDESLAYASGYTKHGPLTKGGAVQLGTGWEITSRRFCGILPQCGDRVSPIRILYFCAAGLGQSHQFKSAKQRLALRSR
ncbi:hypothetical protein Fuma_04564 [Fuerstiella marisgermanici]|uniref:Uncharacterized protein n=1 Tax=Fuerstiella marisgermanici TaxID=1891926 RepID=A0A1P8WLI6_9PLAN|nr:hypothetical protein Fuma_04564 [Fuerstiella marisgermanici]